MEKYEETSDNKNVRETSSVNSPETLTPQPTVAVEEKKTFIQTVLTPGSVWQIIIAALLAIAIGLAVTATVDDIPEACVALLAIPGNLWLRALRCVGKSNETIFR